MSMFFDLLLSCNGQMNHIFNEPNENRANKGRPSEAPRRNERVDVTCFQTTLVLSI